MPYVYIGRRHDFWGKTLWEIVGNLKNFGVGRIVTRGRLDRYPEPSYMKILKVEPLAESENPSIDNPRRVKVLVERTFRGTTMPKPIRIKLASYKTDYRLVPKDEEFKYTQATVKKPDTSRILPKTMELPPLMKELVLRENKSATNEDLKMEIKYNVASSLLKYRIAGEGEKPTVEHSIGLGTPAAPRLYKGISLQNKI